MRIPSPSSGEWRCRRSRAPGRSRTPRQCSCSSSSEDGSCCTRIRRPGGSSRLRQRWSSRSEPAKPRRVVVHVVGAVHDPGLFELDEGSRVDDAIRLRRRREAEGGARAREPRRAGRGRAAGRRACARSFRRRRGRPWETAPGAGGRVHLNSATLEELDTLPGIGPVTAQKILDYRTSKGGVRLGRRARCRPGDRPGPSRRARGAGRPVIRLERVPAPHLIAGGLCAGLAVSLLVRVEGRLAGARWRDARRRFPVAHRRPAAGGAGTCSRERGTLVGERPARRDRRERARAERRRVGLRPSRGDRAGAPRHVRDQAAGPSSGAGRTRRRRAGPARAAARPRRRRRAHSSSSLPPCGGRRPRRSRASSTRRATSGARAFTSSFAPRRTASSVARGGLPGVADRLRLALARSIAPGLEGERRAVVAGIVLGEDEGLDDGLRDAFRASGLYHLLAVSGQNVAFVVAWRAPARLVCRPARGAPARRRRSSA